MATTFEPGQFVNIVGGKYQGKAAVVVRQCPIKVSVCLLDSSGNRTSQQVCLMPHSVSRAISIDTSQRSSDSRSIETDITYPSSTIMSRSVTSGSHMPLQLQMQQRQPRHHQLIQVTPSSSPNLSSAFRDGQRVKVVGGKYKGQMGVITKLCPVKVYVTLERDGRNVCISQSSIQAMTEETTLSQPNFMPPYPPSQPLPETTAPPTPRHYNDSRMNVVVTPDHVNETTRPTRARIVTPPLADPIAVFSTDQAQHASEQTHQVRSHHPHDSVSVSPSSSSRGAQYQRPRTPRVRNLAHVVSQSDVYYDAEDEEYFDANPHEQRQQQQQRDEAPDTRSSRRVVVAESPRSVATVVSSSDNTFHSTTSEQPAAAAVVVSYDDDDNDDAVSYMSVEDVYPYISNEEPEEEGDEDSALSSHTAPPTSLLQRARRYEQPADSVPGQICFEMDKIIIMSHRTTKKCNTFARKLFGDRILDVEVLFSRSVNSVDPALFPTELTFGGFQYHLFSSKIRESCGGTGGGARGGVSFQQTRRVGLLYVAVADLQKELDKIAGFSKLSTRKAVARLELFQSPARKSNRKLQEFLIFDDLNSSMFERIPEVAHEGCGFIPRQFIERFLGSHAVGKRTFALQVRIFAPQLGIFKGMLMEKPGITRIQLPDSMEKVGPSLLPDAEDWACLVVTSAGIHPGSNNVIRGNILNGKAAPRSWNGSQSKLSPMIKTLFEGLNFPSSILKEFSVQARCDRGLVEHANLVGVADPTAALPEGHIFITGLSHICRERSLKHVFVTRFPCTEPKDGCLLPVVTSKPEGMESSVWEWLNGLAFGAIIFANPRPGCPPMPTTIAGGDLDGDLYFVTWKDSILSCLSSVLTRCESPVFELTREVDHHQLREAESRTSHPPNGNWLKDAQDQMADLFTVVHRQALIGKLYTAWHKRVLQSDFGLDSLSFGTAFKEALDIGKHGGPVSLPRHLWQEIPEHLHKFLSE